jgi:hypothetical protein
MLNSSDYGALTGGIVRGVARRVRVFAAVASTFTLVFVSSASGQTQPSGLRDRDPDVEAAKKIAAELQEADIHLGNFYLRSQIKASNSAFAGAITLPSSTAGQNFALTVEAPQRLYYVPTRKTVFTAEYSPGFTFFDNKGKNGQFNWGVRGDAHLLGNFVYLDLYGSRADQLRAHTADLNRLATVREDEIGAAGELKYSSRTSAIFSVRKRDTSYPDRRYQPEGFQTLLLDREEKNARLALRHRTFPLTSIFIAAEASQYDFDNVAARKSSRRYAGLGFVHDRGRTVFRAEAGPTRLEFDDPLAQEGFSGITGSVDWSRSNGRWTYHAGGSRDIGFAVFAQNFYYETTAGTAGMQYAATRRLSLHLTGLYQKDEFPNPVFGNYRTDEAWLVSTGFTYAFRKVGVGADIGYIDRTSTYAGDVESGIRWGLRLSWNL